MPVIVIASSANNRKCSARWEELKSKLNERRVLAENARSMNVKRLRTDVQRMVKKELEFLQEIVDDIVPVRATWNEEAWKNVEQYVPIRIESKYDETKPPRTPDQ